MQRIIAVAIYAQCSDGILWYGNIYYMCIMLSDRLVISRPVESFF